MKTYLRLATLAAVALTMLGCDVIEKHQLFSSRQTTETIAAAKQGDVDAQLALGFMYDHGEGVSENDAEAVKWYRKAADQGLARGQYNLGVMYYNGDGVPENHVRAYVWLSMAKTQGYESAKKAVETVKNLMTKQQIAQAQALATQCYESDYKDCD